MPIQQIRLVVLQDKPAVDTTNSARLNGGGNTQRQGSPHRLSNTHTSKYQRKTDKIITDWSTSIHQWKCGVCGVEPWRRLARATRTVGYSLGIHRTNKLRICVTARPRQLPTKEGNLPRASARNRNVLKKSSDIQKIHYRGRTPKFRLLWRYNQSSCTHW